ncbi:MAG: hypothetical protein KGI58_01460 [Patescibacteria group bacterium]|nr:hypothetical protein [Patescibacteria group bacterium]
MDNLKKFNLVNVDTKEVEGTGNVDFLGENINSVKEVTFIENGEETEFGRIGNGFKKLFEDPMSNGRCFSQNAPSYSFVEVEN